MAAKCAIITLSIVFVNQLQQTQVKFLTWLAALDKRKTPGLIIYHFSSSITCFLSGWTNVKIHLKKWATMQIMRDYIHRREEYISIQCHGRRQKPTRLSTRRRRMNHYLQKWKYWLAGEVLQNAVWWLTPGDQCADQKVWEVRKRSRLPALISIRIHHTNQQAYVCRGREPVRSRSNPSCAKEAITPYFHLSIQHAKMWSEGKIKVESL